MKQAFKLAILVGLLALAGGLQAIAQSPVLVLGPNSSATILGGDYSITVCDGYCVSVVLNEKPDSLRPDSVKLVTVAGDSVCAQPHAPGSIRVASSVPPIAQAKVLIHEVTHIATACFAAPPETIRRERVPEAVADLLASPVGQFVMLSLQNAGGRSK